MVICSFCYLIALAFSTLMRKLTKFLNRYVRGIRLAPMLFFFNPIYFLLVSVGLVYSIYLVS
jgi:hypothetical protein